MHLRNRSERVCSGIGKGADEKVIIRLWKHVQIMDMRSWLIVNNCLILPVYDPLHVAQVSTASDRADELKHGLFTFADYHYVDFGTFLKNLFLDSRRMRSADHDRDPGRRLSYGLYYRIAAL